MTDKTPPFILASQSPRRKELLKKLEIKFEVYPSNIEETLDNYQKPEIIAEDLSRQKANDVAIHFPDKIVIGADTIVVIDHEILGKPTDHAHAVKMLRRLSGRTHEVYTGVTLVRLSRNAEFSFSERTEVTFHTLSTEEINAYVKSNPPLDKAGGYGIQDWEAKFVDTFSGCRDNVIGFPLQKFNDYITSSVFSDTFGL
ncbi:MAG: Maf family protein [Fidelibacterota bacterium]